MCRYHLCLGLFVSAVCAHFNIPHHHPNINANTNTCLCPPLAAPIASILTKTETILGPAVTIEATVTEYFTTTKPATASIIYISDDRTIQPLTITETVFSTLRQESEATTIKTAVDTETLHPQPKLQDTTGLVTHPAGPAETIPAEHTRNSDSPLVQIPDETIRDRVTATTQTQQFMETQPAVKHPDSSPSDGPDWSHRGDGDVNDKNEDESTRRPTIEHATPSGTRPAHTAETACEVSMAMVTVYNTVTAIVYPSAAARFDVGANGTMNGANRTSTPRSPALLDLEKSEIKRKPRAPTAPIIGSKWW